ncbi:MAG: DivIVA domain-containing protein, partial [Clostridia bacterium]|nr:DivIVA domain-containing protein [Clostridia bacterium]
MGKMRHRRGHRLHEERTAADDVPEIRVSNLLPAILCRMMREDSIMPKDFRKKDFGRALRGYSVDEVDSYLEAVTAEYRRLEKRSWDTAKQLADAEKRLDDYA